MTRRSSGALLPGLNLTHGTRMPDTRNRAIELGVSCTTVAQVYEQLKSEGYLIGREKSGTFIPAVLPDAREALAAKRPIG